MQNIVSKWIKFGKQYNINFTKEEQKYIKNNKVKCITTTTWAPFNFIQKDNIEPVGISLDYINLVIKKTGLNRECLIEKNWSNILDKIKNKKADFTSATTITEDKNKYALFSKPYISFPISVATKNNHGYINNTSSLEGKK